MTPAALAWASSIHGRKSAGRKLRERQAEVGEIALRIDQQCREPGPQHLLDQHDAEAGLARAGHADDHAVRRERVGADPHVVAGALVRRRVDRSTEEQLCHPARVVGRCRTRQHHPSHLCYDRRMTVVASRELRNNTRSLLDRVDAGEVITISVDGREVAELRPVARTRRWMPRSEFVHRIVPAQADAALRSELRDLSPDTTDDLR